MPAAGSAGRPFRRRATSTAPTRPSSVKIPTAATVRHGRPVRAGADRTGGVADAGGAAPPMTSGPPVGDPTGDTGTPPDNAANPRGGRWAGPRAGPGAAAGGAEPAVDRAPVPALAALVGPTLVGPTLVGVLVTPVSSGGSPSTLNGGSGAAGSTTSTSASGSPVAVVGVVPVVTGGPGGTAAQPRQDTSAHPVGWSSGTRRSPRNSTASWRQEPAWRAPT
jgi:hypothetical protein